MRFLLFTLKVTLIVALFFSVTKAQTLEERLSGIFVSTLELELAGSIGQHGEHFKPSNVAASAAVINTLNSFIGSSVSSFPLSSTAAGLTFDFSSGRPVSTSTSFGPIFSERAQTIGSGLINMGFNFSAINYTKIRGVNTEDLRLAFTHENRPPDTNYYGDSDFEFDYLDLFMNMDISASIFAFYFTYGVTDNIDFSVAIPFVQVSIKADPLARFNSFTYLTTGTAYHHFGDDANNPILEKEIDGIDDDATGIGDIALRVKYNFLKSETADLASILEYRMASGDEENFLGSGNDRFRISFVASRIMGDFAPHVNLSYEIRNSDTQRDRFGVIAGYDQKLSEKLTLALDFLGEFELGSQNKDLVFPGPITATLNDTTHARYPYSQTVHSTNLPNRSSDNLINGAIGIKFNPKRQLMIIGNVFFPLNDGGLRADFIPTLGIEFNF